MSIEQLCSLKGHIAEGGAILALQLKKHIFLNTRLHHQWNLQQALATLPFNNVAHFANKNLHFQR